MGVSHLYHNTELVYCLKQGHSGDDWRKMAGDRIQRLSLMVADELSCYVDEVNERRQSLPMGHLSDIDMSNLVYTSKEREVLGAAGDRVQWLSFLLGAAHFMRVTGKTHPEFL